MSIQESLTAEYVEKVKKLQESKAIDPQNCKTMKDSKLKFVNCVSKQNNVLLFQVAMMVLQMCTILKICLIVFQYIDKDVLPGDETIHILSHYTICPVNKM